MTMTDRQLVALTALTKVLDDWGAASGTKVDGVRHVAAHPYRQGVQAVIDAIREALDLPEPEETR